MKLSNQDFGRNFFTMSHSQFNFDISDNIPMFVLLLVPFDVTQNIHLKTRSESLRFSPSSDWNNSTQMSNCSLFMASGKIQDLTGKRFTRLTVISFHGVGSRGRYWLCKCDCGNEKITNTYSLTSNHCKSCGCLQIDKIREQGFRNATHGCNRVKNQTTEYGSWSDMRTRCYNPNNKNYPNYGGRGITICDQWRYSFETFLADMGLKPSKKHTLDRIKVNGNYEPSNCRWATRKEQNRNTRANHYITYNGKTQCIADWAEEFGMKDTKLYQNLAKCNFDMIAALERIEFREVNPYHKRIHKSAYLNKR